MRYLKSRVAYGGREWRVIAQTNAPETYVVDGDTAYEFANERAAQQFVAAQYRKIADFTGMQPGNSYTLTMQDGTTKQVTVQQQGPQGVTFTDAQTGETMMVPHVQTGAEPKPAMPGKQTAKPPGPGGAVDAPGQQYGPSPENVTSALCKNDMRREGKVFSDECLTCGKVTHHLDESGVCPSCQHKKASVKVAVITGGPGSYHVKSEEGKNLGGPYKTREEAEHRLKQVEYFKHKGKKTAGCDSDYWEEGDDCRCPIHQKKSMRVLASDRYDQWMRNKQVRTPPRPTINCTCAGAYDRYCPEHGAQTVNRAVRVTAAEVGREPYNCKMDHTYLLRKNPSDPERYCPNCGMVYAAQRVTARDIIANPAPMPGQQGMPSQEVANDSQAGLSQELNEKSADDFAEEPESQAQNPTAKRTLTPHEIIEEAESLIRNALAKGVKIGAEDLEDYMQQQYNNTPQELLQGIALAWEKVQYENDAESGRPPEPQRQMGPRGPGAGLTPQDEVVQSPKML